MTEKHPDPQMLERFMRNAADAQERRRVVRHLLAGCSQCVEVTRQLWRLGDDGPEGEPVEAAEAGSSEARPALR